MDHRAFFSSICLAAALVSASPPVPTPVPPPDGGSPQPWPDQEPSPEPDHEPEPGWDTPPPEENGTTPVPETPTPTPTTPTPTTPTPRPAPPRRAQTCDLLPSSGPGSSAALADQRVATALADIPEASTFVSAIEGAGFTAKFNDENDITVFVPVNKAFSKYGGSETEELFANKEALISFLAYTVVNGRQTPADLTDASLRTKQGGDIEVKNVNGEITLNGTAKVLCSNIQTANANVYLIDTVLPPPE